uniref:DET1- and DDB1-associated protein 1 n=1 Tax=Caenorhabditis japonica TaxID=281687 RepID=A0A8R1HV38_CAEJA
MSNFKLGPLPCRNPESFSKYLQSEQFFEKKQKAVVHRSVEGENNGESYKIKAPKTPFVINHLEKKFAIEREEEVVEAEETSKAGPSTSSATSESRTMKREHSDADDDEASSSQTTSRKKQRQSR